MGVVMDSQSLTNNMYEPTPSYPVKIFKVKNLDDKGRIIHVGTIEVNSTGIIFRYEHHPETVSHWPLNCIRRYGISLEGDVFAFEAGRKAPDGEGMYAFRSTGTQACEIRQRLDYYTHYNSL